MITTTNTHLFLALAGILITAIGSYFTLRFAWKRDEVAKQAGIATTTGDSISRVMQGFSDLNTSLQAENDRVSRRMEMLEHRLEQESEKCRLEIDALKAEITKLSLLPPPMPTTP